MTGSSLLTRLQSFPWQRLSMALFAVPAILIGLLAMHILTNDGMTNANAPHATSAHATGAALAHTTGQAMPSPISSDTSVPAEDCGGLCGPSHDMLSMICVLALLVTIVLLALHLVLSRWEELRRVLLALIARAVALAPPAPPSLYVLSISRT